MEERFYAIFKVIITVIDTIVIIDLISLCVLSPV